MHVATQALVRPGDEGGGEGQRGREEILELHSSRPVNHAHTCMDTHHSSCHQCTAHFSHTMVNMFSLHI